MRSTTSSLKSEPRMRSPIFLAQLETFAYQTDMAPYLSLGDLQRFRIDLPPIDLQRRIASALGVLDDLIDTNVRLVQSMQAGLRALYLRLLRDADCSSVPILEAFRVEFGSAFKGGHFSAPGVGKPLLRIRDLKTFTSDTWTTEERRDQVLVEPGDVVVGMDAEFRPTFWLGPPSLLNQRVCRISRPNGSIAFVREALEDPLRSVEGYKTGTTVIHLNKSDLAQTNVEIPNEDDLADFDLIAEPLRLAIVGITQENEQLRRSRDELLPLLMSGRVAPGEVA